MFIEGLITMELLWHERQVPLMPENQIGNWNYKHFAPTALPLIPTPQTLHSITKPRAWSASNVFHPSQPTPPSAIDPTRH